MAIARSDYRPFRLRTISGTWTMLAFLALLLLTPIAVVVGLVTAYRKLPRAAFAWLLVLLCVSPVVAFKFHVRDFMLDSVPDALDVSSIAYSQEESWGFGPGGNEAGIRVYPLPDHTARRVGEEGIAFLTNMPANADQHDRGWRGLYSDWKQTPIEPGQRWAKNPKTGLFDIYDYICAYGFCIEVDKAIVEEANSIVNAPGSYYAYGRIGVIVVSPDRRRVLYFYNG